MMRKIVLVVLLLSALVIGACGPAMAPTTPSEMATGERFLMAFPRLIIDFDAEGNPSLFGFPLSAVGSLLGQDLGGLKLPKEYASWMTQVDVQHIEMRQTGDSLALMVNGKPMPRLSWSDESLNQALDVAAALNVRETDILRQILPAVRRLGLSVVLRFPRQDGVEEIPLADPALALEGVKPTEASPTVLAQFEITYDEQGVPSILGISARDLSAMGINLPLAIAPNYLASLQAENVQYLEVRAGSDGIFLYANGSVLPNLAWDQQLLANAAELYAQMNPTSPAIAAIDQLVPLLAGMDITVLLHFPPAAGVEAIPIEVH